MSNSGEIHTSVGIVTQMDSNDQAVDPKTKGSTRTVRAAAELIEELRMQFDGSHDELIIRTRNGSAVSQENQRRSLTSACLRAGVEPVTPYELRHTAITHQVEAGHGVSQIADWAGTSEKMIFEHYRHRLHEISDVGPVIY